VRAGEPQGLEISLIEVGPPDRGVVDLPVRFGNLVVERPRVATVGCTYLCTESPMIDRTESSPSRPACTNWPLATAFVLPLALPASFSSSAIF
jgi:hypothetical protein